MQKKAPLPTSIQSAVGPAAMELLAEERAELRYQIYSALKALRDHYENKNSPEESDLTALLGHGSYGSANEDMADLFENLREAYADAGFTDTNFYKDLASTLAEHPDLVGDLPAEIDDTIGL